VSELKKLNDVLRRVEGAINDSSFKNPDIMESMLYTINSTLNEHKCAMEELIAERDDVFKRTRKLIAYLEAEREIKRGEGK